ncbi:MAG: exo-alpha-sialidase, partial [Candidatus Aminicenantes bacterium]
MWSKRHVFFSFLIFGIFSFTLIQTSANLFGTDLVAGRNVNMVNDDPFLQRQNEPSVDVSSINPRHLLAGANDYSLVYFNGLEVDVTYDSWLGVFKSYDGGESWEHDMLPPYQGVFQGADTDETHLLYGFEAAADPTVRAGNNGWFYYSGIAFDRERNGDSVVFVVRYKDNGSRIDYVDTNIIDVGTSGQFKDKPWIVSDKLGRVYLVYSIFQGEINVLGQSAKSSSTKIMMARSFDSGDTWEAPSKLSESQHKNQGTTITIDPDDGTIYVAWRRFARPNVTDAIVITKSENFGKHFSKVEEVATIDFPFDQPTMGYQDGASMFRTLSFPTMAVDASGRIYVAWSQRISAFDDARIVITSLDGENWGSSWPTPVTIEPLSIDDPRPGGEQNMPCHQFMPTMIYRPGVDKLMIA